ncbi:hypothetical protein [Thalassobacillus devorans]|uniref:hypothetical protein n=1 Tax=Thalassobacillus devorans TaxID=279813 RepID=UPI000A1CA95E|nr:hypothetical protein [Thalassobacillus devorans]
MRKKGSKILDKLDEWQSLNTSYLKEIKHMAEKARELNTMQIIGYFTYSFNIQHKSNGENICIGNFHILNAGSRSLSNPYICIKVSNTAPFTFSGKYVYKDSKQKLKLSNAWERINGPEDREEFWLKPVEIQSLEPSETLVFSNFQLKWEAGSSYTGGIMGYIYGDEIQGGINAFNQINFSGKVSEGENDDK